MALQPRVWVLCAALAAASALGPGAGAQELPPSPLEIVSKGPQPEFRIHGVSLKSVRADDAQNAVAFDFNGPVSDEAFARLQDELPDWVEMAYAGYDNAIIRARRPVTFMTKAESDGFSMRLVPKGDAAAPAPAQTAGLRGGADGAARPLPPSAACASGNCPPPATAPFRDYDWRSVTNVYARVAVERPFDTMIRGAYDALRDGGTSAVFLDTDWRNSHNGTQYAADLRANIVVWDGVKLMANVHEVLANSHATRQPGGAIAPFNDNDTSGSLGVSFPVLDGHASAEALYGRSGWGARIGMSGGDGDFRYGMRAAYHEPYVDSGEDLAFHGTRDYSAVFAAGQLFDGLWAAGEVRGTRYGIKGDDNVATSVAFHAGLRWDIEGFPITLNYDADGEYLLSSHSYPGVPPTPFVPLSLRDREVHAFGGSFSQEVDRGFWFDLYGGYAIDRYANRGPYGGAGLRFTPAPGWDLLFGGRYSTVADREGGGTNKMSAGLKLTYAWGGDAPIMHGGAGL